MISIYYTIFHSRLPDGEFQSLLSILPPKDQNRIKRFKHWQDRQIHLSGRRLLLKGLTDRGYTPNILALEQVRLEKESATFSGKKWFTKKVILDGSYICNLATSKAVDAIYTQEISPKNLNDILDFAHRPSSLDVGNTTDEYFLCKNMNSEHPVNPV